MTENRTRNNETFKKLQLTKNERNPQST